MKMKQLTAVVFLSMAILVFWSNRVSAFTLRDAGDVGQFIPTTVALTLIADKKDIEGLKQLGLSSGSGAAVAYGLKYGLNIKRPNGHNYSMPSGHAWFAFNGAEFIRKRYGWKWGVPMYAVSAMVGYSRVEAGVHRPQDVVVAAAIPLVSNYFFTDAFEKYHFSVTPLVDTHSAGIALDVRW